MPDGHKAQAWGPFTVFYSIRCAWYLLCFAAMSCLPGFTLARATLADRLKGRRLAIGFGVGAVVMGASILLMILGGQADVAYLQDSTPVAVAYAGGWIATSLIGALAFTPTGSVWITGGAAGPEGSVFAFVAMGVAYRMLMHMSSCRDVRPDRRQVFSQRPRASTGQISTRMSPLTTW